MRQPQPPAPGCCSTLDPCHFPRRPAGCEGIQGLARLSWEAVQLNDMPTPEDFRRYREVVDAVEQAWSGEGSVEIRKLFHNATPLPHPPGRGTYLVENAPQAEVLLHPGAGELLAGPPGAPAAGLVGVWLGNTEAGIAVNAQGGQVGVLRDEDVVAYTSIMRLANDKGAVPVMPAV